MVYLVLVRLRRRKGASSVRRLLCCVTLAAGIVACHEPDEYRLGPSEVAQVLGVAVTSQAMPADGISKVTITAQLDPRTDADKRGVTFTTTNGVLVSGAREAMSMTVQADATGKAAVELRSPITPGSADIEVRAASVIRTTSVAFLILARSELFDVTVSRDSIPADGFSTSVITAFLRRIGTLQQRAVKFETSAGSLIASGQEPSRVVNLTADSTGKAEVSLRSEKLVGTARVRVTTLEIPHEFSIAFTPVDPAQIITLSTDRSSVAADGVTPIAITASVAPGLPDGRRRVTFFSTLGQLVPSTTEADGDNTARARIISTATGTARISATVDGTTAETTAQFTPALPNRLHISLGASELKSGDTSSVTVTLIRDTGTVSPHLKVSYTARTSSDSSFGRFSAITLAENGIATATYQAGTTASPVSVTIKATVEGGPSAEATLRVVP